MTLGKSWFYRKERYVNLKGNITAKDVQPELLVIILNLSFKEKCLFAT